MSDEANSGIGQQAAITLLTAVPGSGKTLRLVGWLKQAVEAGETVYACGINGLQLPHLPWDDPSKWRDLPPGSILAIDEAQRYFPATRSDPPEWMRELSVIRHHGIRMILTTQQPSYLHTHVRGLVGCHEHLVRENGKEAAKIWRHNEVIEDVRSERGRARYDSEVWIFPKEHYALYKSAEVHTVKYKMSSRMKRGLMFAGLAGVLALGVAYRAYGDYLAPVLDKESPGAQLASGELPPGDSISARAQTGPAAPVTPEELAQQLTPRIDGLPWSAPVFDGRQAKAEPEIFCMSSEAGRDAAGEWRPASVTCFTEQGTRHVLPDKLARHYARHGTPYNPYKAPDRAQAAPARLERAQPTDMAGRGLSGADREPGALIEAPEVDATATWGASG